jgi:hypothetical protein
MWQMQWPYPSPYVTATPVARLETSHRFLYFVDRASRYNAC